MSDENEDKYDEEYIAKIFEKDPILKRDVNKIKERMRHFNDPNGISASDVRELFNNLMRIFADENSQNLWTFDKLTIEQKKLIFLEIEKIADEISAGGDINQRNNILNIIIKDQTEKYIMAKDPEDFLTEADKKRIREELKRIAEFEIYKVLNPKRIAGETRSENFLNNMIIGGAELAKNFEGHEYLNKLSPDQTKNLINAKEKFDNNHKLEIKDGARTIKNIGEFQRRK